MQAGQGPFTKTNIFGDSWEIDEEEKIAAACFNFLLVDEIVPGAAHWAAKRPDLKQKMLFSASSNTQLSRQPNLVMATSLVSLK